MISIKTKNIDAKHIAGMNIITSPANSKAPLIWKSFMPRRNEIHGPESDVYYSIQEYPMGYSFDKFNPTAEYTTWAAKEIHQNLALAADFSSTIIKGGLYAMWTHTGTAATISKDMFYFHTEWLPTSGYMLDKTRKHFERLGKDYLGPQDPLSKEEVYIPIIPNTFL